MAWLQSSDSSAWARSASKLIHVALGRIQFLAGCDMVRWSITTHVLIGIKNSSLHFYFLDPLVLSVQLLLKIVSETLLL